MEININQLNQTDPYESTISVERSTYQLRYNVFLPMVDNIHSKTPP